MSAPENEKSQLKGRPGGLASDQIRRKNAGKSVPAGPRGVSVTDKGTIWDERADNSNAFLDDASTPEPERVRVTIRVRPATADELQANAESVMDIEPSKNLVVLHREEPTEFVFDAVMPPSATQADIYNVAARPIVYDVLNGYNGTIMAYGQTGAGKTYTLSSTIPQHHGIIPRAASEIFMVARLDNDNEYRVSMSYIQIYMEMIQDLLRPSSFNMQIRESENGVYVSGVEEVEVKSVDDCLKLLSLGERNRAFAFTKLNAHSSRSHAIAVITVEKRTKKSSDNNVINDEVIENENVDNDSVGVLDSNNERHENSSQISDDNGSLNEEKKSYNMVKEKILVGKLFLVDLAGSERLKKSGSEGMRANEAKSINLSLTCLGKCINARADPNSTHVPFRDSKLTRLLQESLGGNAKTSLVINVAPSEAHTSESLSSLKFGSRAMKVKTKAIINEEEEFKLLSRNMADSSEINHDERVQSLEVVVYSQEEQLAQAKSKLDRQIQEANKILMEKVNLMKKQERDLEERDKYWESQLHETQTSGEKALEEAKQRYQENLAETVESMNSQRAQLAETLKISKSRILRLENQVRLLQKLLNKNSDTKREDSEFDFLDMAELEDAIQSEKEDQAARVIQKRFRQYRLDKILAALAASQMEMQRSQQQINQLETENRRLEELASIAGHKMVSASMHHVTSLITSLNKRFLTPKNMY